MRGRVGRVIGSILTLKEEVLEHSKKAYQEALFAGTSGNLSALDPETGRVVITPTSYPYDIMQIEDLVVIELDGTVVEGRHRPSSEWRMHCEIYKHRRDVRAVVHTHSPYATAFAVAGKRIPLILIEMVPFIGGDIPVAEFRLPGSQELGLEAVRALIDRNACLLANHGVVAIGNSLDQAHIRAVYAEDAARIYHHAIGIGDVRLVPEESVEQMTRRLSANQDKTAAQHK